MGALWQLSCAFALHCMLLYNVDISLLYVNVGVSPPWPRGFNLTVSAPFLGLGGGWSSQGYRWANGSSDVLSNGTASRVGWAGWTSCVDWW